MKFKGEMCGRKWECDKDMSEELENCESATRSAMEIACCMVENEEAWPLAEAKIVDDGGKTVVSAECEGRKWSAECETCETCGKINVARSHKCEQPQ
jgi:hypothetical protein